MSQEKYLEVTVELTAFCPFNCQHCSTWFSPYYDVDNEKVGMNEIEISKIIDITIEYIKILKNTLVIVRFSGGEPMYVLDKWIFKRMLKECKNIKGFIITTSGAMSVKHIYKNYDVSFGDVKNLSYRISLYGNKEDHTLILRNYNAFDCAIDNTKILMDNGIPVEFTTPIFYFSSAYHTIEIAKKFDIPVRMFRLLQTPIVKPLSQRNQLLIARILHLLYHKAYLTCSLYGECKKRCDYPKTTILATGKIIGCAIDKIKRTSF